MAGRTVRIDVAGEGLGPRVFPALEHRRVTPEAAPDATFLLFDTAGTGVAMPPPPCDRDRFTDRGDLWGFDSPRIRTAFHYSDFSVNVMDLRSRVGVHWVRDARDLPYWAEASPLRTLFHWWMEAEGAQLVHAAAVGGADGAVLLPGRGGSGKSTAALACLAGGLLYAGDDYVVVRGGPEPTVHGLYATAKLEPAWLGRFPELGDCAVPRSGRGDDKRVLSLHPRFADRLPEGMALRAVLAPRVADGEETSVAPASPEAVAHAACFSTLSQLPGAGRRAHETLWGLCGVLPAASLRVGRDLSAIPGVVARHLAAPGRPDGAAPAPAARVSVVIPVHNGARFVAEAVASVRAQGYPALELILVDDGSTDGTDAAIRALPGDVRHFRQENQGAAAARNRGIREAAGELIAFLDVDDLWPAGSLGLLVAELSRDPGLLVARGHAQLMVRDPQSGAFEYRGSPREAFPDYVGAALCRREAFARVGPFDPALRYGEDMDWFNRAREAGLPMRRIDAVTLLVRRHGANMTHGKTLVELNLLRVFKKRLDRLRDR